MNTDKHGSEIEQLREENRRLRKLAMDYQKTLNLVVHRPRIGKSVEDCWAQDGTVSMNVQHLISDLEDMHQRWQHALAQPAPAPAEGQQPEPAKDRLREMTDEEADALIERVEDAVGMGKGAWDMTPGRELARSFVAAIAASDGGLLDYPEAARVIALWLKDFCDEGKTYPDMIADAARKAGEEIGRLRKISGDYRKAVELITRRPRIGKSAEDCWAQDGTVSMNVRHLISDLEDMHQRWQQAIAASKGEVQHG